MSSVFGNIGSGLSEANEFVAKYLLGFALGTAAAPALAPFAQTLANDAWKLNQDVPPLVYVLAEGVAQGQVDPDSARAWAHEQGFGDSAFDALIDIANVGPGVPAAFELWRRGKIDQPGFERAAKRAGLEDEWIAALVQLKRVLLSPAELANAVVQGHMEIGPATALAALQGLEADDFAVMVANTGLPPGPETGLAWLRRGILNEGEFADVVREGHTKAKYIDKYLAALHPVLSALQYVEARVRGWITTPEMVKGGALTGYDAEQMDLLFKIHGRPLSFHQVWIGLQRGGTYDGPTTGIAPPFLKALQESNIRPEWYSLAWAQRYSYPSAFVMRALVQTGVLTPAEGETDLLDMGWRPDRAKQVAQAWAGGSGSAGHEQTKTELLAEYAGGYMSEDELRGVLDTLGYSGATLDREVHLADARRNASQRERVVKVIGDAYRQHAIDETTATTELAEVNVLGDAAARLLALWEKERRFTRKELTDRQVATAFKKGRLSRDAALAELEERGFSADDAATELAI